MPSTLSTLLVGALSASLAAGAVVPFSVGKGNFEVKRAPNAEYTGRNGPLALARAYNKYGVHVSPELLQAVENKKYANHFSRRDEGNATATPDDNDLEYLVPVQIGTPAQTLNLDFDTGSSDLWVFSSETGSSSASGHDIYTPGKSSTSKKLSGASWKISYGDGSSSSGDVYTDAVSVGSLKVSGQAVESATKVSSEFAQGNNDGLLGLGFSSINTVKPTQQKTFFDNVKGDLDQPLFVADLRHDTAGSYIFGAVPDDASDALYADVDNSQGWWQFQTTAEGSDFSAIADTGTTLLLVADDVVDAYYKKVSGAKNDSQQGGYVFPCSTDLPDFTFTVGSGKITVPGDLINYASAGASTCFGGIQSAGDIGVAIFGDVALKSSYVIFDGGKEQVGWAQKV